MSARFALALCAALASTVACDDPGSFGNPGADARPPSGTSDAAGGNGGNNGGQTSEPDVGPLPAYDLGPPDGPEPGYVELTLAPVDTLYSREDHPVATARVFDRFGDLIPDARVEFSIVPAGTTAIETDGASTTLTFLQEGPGALRACAATARDVCGRATYFVDDGGPTLTLTHPTPGEVVMGRPIVVVEGTASGEGVAVFVNDLPVELDETGAFRTELPARFGFNRVEVVADDGVQRPATREVREALYAPRFLVPGAASVDVGVGLALRLSQRLLDTGAPPGEPDAEGVTHLHDLAALLEALIARIEPLTLLGDPVLAQGEPLDLTIEAVSPGTPDVALTFTETGLDLFLRLTDFSITPRGRLLLEGESVDLHGALLVSAAAYVRVGLVAGPGGAPVLSIEAADVAIERLAGRMDDSTAQAVLDTFGSLLRTVLEGYARDRIDDLIRAQVPEFIELGLGDVLSTVADLPLDVEADGVVPALHLRAGFRLSAPTVTPRGSLTLSLTGAIRQPMPVQAPHPDPGVADETDAEAEEAGPPWPAAAGAAVAVRMRVINALLHELWRQGALQLDLTSVIPENLRALVSSVRLDAHLPPLVTPAPPGAPYLFELQLGELDFETQAAQNPAPDLYTLSIRVGLTLTVSAAGLHFDIAPEPDVRVALRQAGGARPFLPPEALADLIANLVWAELSESIGNGLDLAVPEIHLGPEALGALAPSVADVHVLPVFPDVPRVRNGWFVLGAEVEARLR